MQKIYWVGPRQSDIQNVVDFDFAGSLTIFGDGNYNVPYCGDGVSRVNHNLSDKKEDEFFYNQIKLLIENEDALFYFYNPNAVNYIDGLSKFSEHFLCVNSLPLMQKANDKDFFYEVLQGKVPLLARQKVNETNCDYIELLKNFGKTGNPDTRFIIQAHISSGGNGTFIVDKNNIKKVVESISEPNDYSITVYEEDNIPVNMHIIIFEDEILLLPGSVQIMHEDSNRLLYRGADFVAYSKLPSDIKEKFENNVRKACTEYQKCGYRGVCGIDGIICGEQIYLLELNNRFQASTGLINIAASIAGLPSIQTVNYAAFYGQWQEEYRALEHLEVNFSNYFYSDNGTKKFHADRIYENALALLKEKENKDLFAVQLDGYSPTIKTDALAYLFRLVFSTNIVSLDTKSRRQLDCVQINENISEPKKELWYDIISQGSNDVVFGQGKKAIRDYFLHLKIALMMQGVVISEEANNYLNSREEKGIRPATNNAVDIKINIPVDEDGKACADSGLYIVINAPTDVKFVEFSPFDITYENGKLCLNYYGEYIAEPIIYPRDFLENNKTKAGTAYEKVGFLSTDRLRVHLTNNCIYKQKHQGCTFCNIKNTGEPLTEEDIKEVVSDYCKNAVKLKLRHFLVGGQTAPKENEKEIIKIIKIIRENAPYADIYAMVIPYPDEMITEMYYAGMTQLSCNVEIFDDDIALKYMPGKRLTTRADYLHTLSYATTLIGTSGNVRTMVVVGLEKRKTLIEGIIEFTEHGIQPILSVFRPLPGTPLADMVAPSMLSIKEVYEKILKICKEQNLLPGPKCINCQNNTLALPDWMEE